MLSRGSYTARWQRNNSTLAWSLLLYDRGRNVSSSTGVTFRESSSSHQSGHPDGTLHQAKSSADGALALTSQEVTHKIFKMISAFRDRGHYAAQLDPLSKQESTRNTYVPRPNSWLPQDPRDHPDVVRLLQKKPILDLEPFELQSVPIDEKFEVPGVGEKGKLWSLASLVEFLSKVYCSTVGFEYAHIENDKQRIWLQEKAEELGGRGWGITEKKEKAKIFEQVVRTDLTAAFLTKTFPSSKVFGIEGCESLIPGLKTLLDTASSMGCEAIEMGMAHRGRMNVLHNVLQKPLHAIAATFSETDLSELGDVKYHLGTRAQVECFANDGSSKVLHISLAANPSHLEAVNPVVIGRAKAKQFFIEDTSMKRVCPLLLHGDASFSGQGIVPETLELSDLPDYTVGGTVHVVINNQVGFTTNPRTARTSYHCTNCAKGVGAPILHVNSDDVEAVTKVFRMAIEFRQLFGRDVVVDLVGYRRHGHNSQDDPSITQPLTYKLIRDHPSVMQIYSAKLVAENTFTSTELNEFRRSIEESFAQSAKANENYTPDPLEWLASNWQGAAIGSLLSTRPYNQTGVRIETLRAVGTALTTVPPDFVIHKDMQKLLISRSKILATGEGVTMAFAEAFAFGSLMSKFTPGSEKGLRGLTLEKRTVESAHKVEFNTLDAQVELQEHPCVHVRLSGQDVIRGTFNQRHAAIYCQKTGKSYWQLNNLSLGGLEQATMSVCNSALSEAAVLGFEYGYSLSNEMALTLWEAQFGDFANNAQCVIDNFLSSGENKWSNFSSLVVLLPHGYDGQGPEHSSGRLERFLQLVDDDEDAIPGKSAFSKAEMQSGFDAISSLKSRSGGVLDRAELGRILSRLSPGASAERIELTLAEIMAETGTSGDEVLTKDDWCRLMEAWHLRNSERKVNLVVVAPSTPAQYFHCLRRQIHRPFSKPLVCFSGKWLLHHKHCVSRLDDLAVGTFFQRLIVEGGLGDNMRGSGSGSGSEAHQLEKQQLGRRVQIVHDEEIRRVIFCSGKVFYHLFHAREASSDPLAGTITLVRLEQIAPFPYDLVGPTLARFSNADVCWVQEEPKNMGAWSYVRPRLKTCMRENGLPIKPILYRGRKPSSSPASGGYTVHIAEQKVFVEAALRLED